MLIIWVMFFHILLKIVQHCWILRKTKAIFYLIRKPFISVESCIMFSLECALRGGKFNQAPQFQKRVPMRLKSNTFLANLKVFKINLNKALSNCIIFSFPRIQSHSRDSSIVFPEYSVSGKKENIKTCRYVEIFCVICIIV